MPQVVPPGFAHCLIPFNHPLIPRAAVITFGLEISGTVTPVNELIDEVVASFVNSWTTFIDSQVLVGPGKMVVGQDGPDNLSVDGVYTAYGAATSDRAWANTALLLTKLTEQGGRRGKGRMYLPWCLAESVPDEAGRIAPASVATAQTAADDWLADLVAIDGVEDMVVLHSTGVTQIVDPSPVTRLLVSNVIGTQRRRLNR